VDRFSDVRILTKKQRGKIWKNVKILDKGFHWDIQE